MWFITLKALTPVYASTLSAAIHLLTDLEDVVKPIGILQPRKNEQEASCRTEADKSQHPLTLHTKLATAYASTIQKKDRRYIYVRIERQIATGGLSPAAVISSESAQL